MGRIFISKKAVLNRLNDILNTYPSLESYSGYAKLMRELRKFREEIENDDPILKPELIELPKE